MVIESEPPPLVVVMGVSGAGKTTIGRGVAARLGVDFVEGDRLHPDENLARMAAGEPLDDEHRGPWLDAIAAEISRHKRDGRGVVVSCSALRSAYRDRLRGAGPVRFVFLDPGADELRRRLGERDHEFMPPTLLDSQLAALEPPRDEPDAVRVEPASEIEVTIDRVLTALAGLSRGNAGPARGDGIV